MNSCLFFGINVVVVVVVVVIDAVVACVVVVGPTIGLKPHTSPFRPISDFGFTLQRLYVFR